jgi:hypothetical protein
MRGNVPQARARRQSLGARERADARRGSRRVRQASRRGHSGSSVADEHYGRGPIDPRDPRALRIAFEGLIRTHGFANVTDDPSGGDSATEWLPIYKAAPWVRASSRSLEISRFLSGLPPIPSCRPRSFETGAGSFLEEVRQMSAIRRSAAFLMLLMTWCVRPVSSCTVISATSITINTTWGATGTPADSCYIISNTITISAGATLTIQPGTVLYFNSGTSLIIGGPSSAGQLNAAGTGAAPVVFTALNAQHGGWSGLDFRDFSDFGGASSTLDHCVIKKGGGTGGSGAMIKVTSTSGLTLTNSLISDYRNNGVDLTSASVTITQCTFRDSIGTYPVTGSPRDAWYFFAFDTFTPKGTYDGIALKAGTISQSTSLSVPPAGFCYVLEPGEFAVEGGSAPILGIAAGTVLKFSSGARLLAGINNVGGIQAAGTVFTSTLDDTIGDTAGDGITTGAPGQWRCVIFGGNTVATSYLDGCEIRYGGATDNAGLRLQDPVSVTNCVIEKNSGYGLSVEGGGVTAGKTSGNLIRDNSDYEVIAPPVAMASIVPNNTVSPSSNGKLNGYLLRSGTVPLSANLSKPPAGFCYVLEPGEFAVEGGSAPILGIAAGTVLKFSSGARLLAGINNVGGIQARGVVFTSSLDDTIADTPGDGPTLGAVGQWRCVIFGPSTLVTSYLDSCEIRYGGATDNAGLRLQDPVSVTRCVIEKNSGYGLSVEGGSVTAGNVSGNLIRDNTSYEVIAPPVAMANIVPNNTVNPSSNGKLNGYVLRSGTVPLNATLVKPPDGFCYVVETGETPVEGGSDPLLAIMPGAVLKFSSGSRLLVGPNTTGRLLAKGVVFTSLQDDSLGDTGGDGITAGAPGQWRGIYFGPGARDESALSCCTVRFAGATSSRAIEINGSSPSFAYTAIVTNTGDGIYANGSGAKPSIVGSTITGNTDEGVEVVSNARPVIRQSNLSGNTTGAVRTNSTTTIVDAMLNWWGSASGPSDTSPGAPDQNPGSGAFVSDYVKYRPWLTSSTTPVCDFTVAVQHAQVSLQATSDAVEVTWYTDGSTSTEVNHVERRSEGGEWKVVGLPVEEDGGALSYVDRTVQPGARYGYRLMVSPAGAAEVPYGEVWVDVPLRATLALMGARPNPSYGMPQIALSLPNASPSQLEVFDVSGRRVAEADMAGMGMGTHLVQLRTKSPLVPGTYMVRLKQGNALLHKYFVVLR